MNNRFYSGIFLKPPQKSFLSDENWWRSLGIGSLLLILIIIFDRWPILMGHAAPSGADPGNWLAFAWQLTGDHIRLADWAYPPVIIVLLRGLLFIFEPLIALKLVGLFAWIFMSTAFFVMLRLLYARTPAYIHVILAVLFSLAGYQGEVVAWGGYPQIMGMAFLLVGLPATEMWLKTGYWGWLVMAASTLLGVIFTHHLLTSLLPPLLIIIGIWALVNHAQNYVIIIKRSLLLSILIGCVAIFAIPIYWQIAENLVENPLNSQGFSVTSLTLMFEYVFQDALWVWVSLLIGAALLPVISRNRPSSSTIFTMTWGVFFILVSIWEVRILQLFIAGSIYGLALFIDSWWQSEQIKFKYLQIVQFIILASCSLLVFLILPNSHQWFQTAVSTGYRIIDDDFLAAMEWVKQTTQKEDRIVVSYSDDPQGWWIEGFTQRETLYATNAQWLFFEEEEYYTEIANEIFDQNTPLTKSKHLIDRYSIDWLFIDKSTYEQELPDLIHQGHFTAVYENDRILILEVDP